MNIQERLTELIMIGSYGDEFRTTNNLFVFINKVSTDNILNTVKFEQNKEILTTKILSILTSISRRIIQELKEDKYDISERTEISNGQISHTYFDRKKNVHLDSRADTYPTNDILLYHNKVLKETEDFFGKKEVLDIFYEGYLKALSHEAKMECIYLKRDMNALLDLFNNPRYKEVREESIVPALSDNAAEQLSMEELKFKSIEEAEKAYEKDRSLETLAQLKKLHMIEAINNTQNCHNIEELGEMLNEAKLDCVKSIIIGRMAYLDATNS